MLVIRMQRTGRKGHAMFRVVVQDSRRTPTSGRVVAQLGSYDPHAKTISLSKEKAQFYLDNGAQPSERVAKLLKQEGIKLPSWVASSDKKAGTIRNLEKLRRNRPAEEAPAEPETAAEIPAEEPAADNSAETEAAAEPTAEAPTEEAPIENVEPTPETEAPSETAEPAPAEPAAEAEKSDAK